MATTFLLHNTITSTRSLWRTIQLEENTAWYVVIFMNNKLNSIKAFKQHQKQRQQQQPNFNVAMTKTK